MHTCVGRELYCYWYWYQNCDEGKDRYRSSLVPLNPVSRSVKVTLEMCIYEQSITCACTHTLTHKHTCVTFIHRSFLRLLARNQKLWEKHWASNRRQQTYSIQYLLHSACSFMALYCTYLARLEFSNQELIASATFQAYHANFWSYKAKLCLWQTRLHLQTVQICK